MVSILLDVAPSLRAGVTLPQADVTPSEAIQLLDEKDWIASSQSSLEGERLCSSQ